MNFRGTNCVMAVLGFTVSALFIAFVCIRLIAGRIQSAATRRAFPNSPRSDPNSLESGLRGLEPHVIAKFSMKKYSDAKFRTLDDSQCVICLAEYCKKDTIRILPYCGHFFHVLCIDKWLQQHSTCPVCRISLRYLPMKTNMPPMLSSSIRSHYHTESLHFNPYLCLAPIQDRPVRGNEYEDQQNNPVRENMLSVGLEVRESVSRGSRM